MMFRLPICTLQSGVYHCGTTRHEFIISIHWLSDLMPGHTYDIYIYIIYILIPILLIKNICDNLYQYTRIHDSSSILDMYKYIIYRVVIPRAPEDRTRMPIAGFGINRYRPRFCQTWYTVICVTIARDVPQSSIVLHCTLLLLLFVRSYLGGVYIR